MGKYIVKLNGKYLIWSTIVDAPVTRGMTKDQLEGYIGKRDGQTGLDQLPARLQRADATGISAHDCTLDDLEGFNRAGRDERGRWDESHWTLAQIAEHYCPD